MMGAFSAAVRDFTEHNIAVVPTRSGTPSKPMVLRPDRIGLRASRTFASDPKYADANAAVWAGKRNGLTIVDIDSSDPTVARDAIDRFGDTPLKVETASRGLHLYFAHRGEGRRVRPFGTDDLPLDVIGNGLCVLPPSAREAGDGKCAGGYRIVQGSLDDLGRLPVIRDGALPPVRACNPSRRTEPDNRTGAAQQGSRNDALFRYGRRVGRSFETEAELMECLLAKNATFTPPLPFSEVANVTANVWRYRMRGTLFGTGSQAAVIPIAEAEILAQYAPAAALMMILKANHAVRREPFAIVPTAMAPKLQWSPRTVLKARDWLLRHGFLKLVSRGGMTEAGRRPNLYRLTT